MVLRQIQDILESWAPKELAWERDNVGLQVGAPDQSIRKILIAVDVTDAVVEEARDKNIDLIISHHPLLFHPLKSVQTNERVGRLVSALTNHGIGLVAAHTNLDFTQGGVSFALAEKLQLHDIEVLHKHTTRDKKIAVFVPASHVETVAASMAAVGAGVIGKYDHCSFRMTGVGTFKPMKGATPYLGSRGRVEHVEEVRLEMIVPSWKLHEALKAMRLTHPYEEVAYDVYDLHNNDNNYGAGAIGNLKRSLRSKEFFALIKHQLRTPTLRYAGKPTRRIKRVAVCGGSGSDLLPVAIREDADAFVTADISYHKFQENDGRLTLIDAGHFETEYPTIKKLVTYLEQQLKQQKAKVSVIASSVSTNFVQYSLQ